MNAVDLLDAVNVIDRVAGAISAVRQGQMGKQVRVRHASAEAGAGARQMNDYADILERYKIPVYWKRATSTHCIFNVRAGQWQWAVDLLFIAGADVEHTPRPWARQRQGRLPTPWEWSKQR